MIRRLLPVFVLLALTLVVFNRLAFTDWIMARGDTFSYHYPYWAVRAEAFRAGRLPLWTPDLFMGAPLLANPQIGAFYPPNWLVAPLSPPDAVRVSAIAHVFWAALGAYALARRMLGAGRAAALIGAAGFALGGHLGAHVEQINQLQGLAWLPWLLFLFDRAYLTPTRCARPPLSIWRGGRGVRFAFPLLAMAWALQILSGHTQTVFISGVALALYALCTRPARGLLTLAFAGVGAVLLALPQLIPTLELSSLSNRSGGFNVNQATAFSFSPFVTGRGLLPSFDRMIFSEYIAYPGIVMLALAWIGLIPRPSGGERRRPLLRWIILAAVGLALAYGLYNPLYLALAGLPGFNLFRVPARWLALFALGAAMLAAAGADRLLRAVPQEDESTGALRGLPFVRAGIFAALIVGLMALAPLAAHTPDQTPTYPPEAITWIGWIAALAIGVGAVLIASLRPLPLLAGRWQTRIRRGGRTLVLAAAVLELILASGALAYNQLVTPDAFSAQRFSISQMSVYSGAGSESTPPGRLLSLSDLQFDPGDRAALEARYEALNITGEARALAFDTVKLKEVLAANQPVLWGIPSVDGFDGGLLPTRFYTAFTALLPPDEIEGVPRTLDGRLREILYDDACGGPCIPELRWLRLTDTRYLLTDKVYDLVHDGVFYDTALPVSGSAVYPNRTGFTAAAVEVLYACQTPPCDPPRLHADDVLLDAILSGEAVDRYFLARYPLDPPRAAAALIVETAPGGNVRAVTLVNAPDETFAQLSPDPYRRVLSSDIKLYELPASSVRRAFAFTAPPLCVKDDEMGTEAALDLMRDAAFDPAAQVVLTTEGCRAWESLGAARSEAAPEVQILAYSAERITLQVAAAAPSILLLTDAYYPGWTAALDGSPVPIYRADVMFRAILTPAGAHQIVFEYRPAWLPGILVAGVALWLIAGAGLALAFARHKST
ncbi:MAG: YfhO family protein [Anaerolineae bacterium]|nr:YfhO family protein [Anaerolineae bacterium]